MPACTRTLPQGASHGPPHPAARALPFEPNMML